MPGLNPIKTTDYAGGFHYEDADGVSSGPKKLLFFAHEEGRVRIDNEEPIYEMYLQDSR
ncbi:MAG: hypothetical protein AAF587_40645 [Bacteroidota bacterium]